MDANNPNYYDYKKEFKAQCLPHIIKLKQWATSYGVPFYMTFAVKNSKTETEYMTSKQIPPETGLELADDMIRKIILAERGFDLMVNNLDTFDMDFLPKNATDPTLEENPEE